jgi:hypothetical protein
MTTAVLRNAPYISSPTRREMSSGVSQVAQQLSDQVKRSFEDVFRSATGQRKLATPLAELKRGYDESQALGIDDQRLPPTIEAFREAAALIRSLPSWAPPPTAVIEPSGAIGLEWYFGPSKFLVLAVDGTGRFEYSAILGPGEDHHDTINFTEASRRHALDLLGELLKR